MNNVDYVVICVNEGVNKCNLHLILEHPDPGPVDRLSTCSVLSIYASFYSVSVYIGISIANRIAQN